MKTGLRIFMAGMLVSFAGSLPLGSMNVAATEITIRDGINAAIVYALGSMLIEIIYVRVILSVMNWIYEKISLFRILGLVTAFILIVMAIASFRAAFAMADPGTALPHIASQHFLYGLLLSAINPLHVPFWFGWSSFLLSRKILLPGNGNYNLYIGGIAAGTMGGFMVFIFGGNYFIDYIRMNQSLINWAIGIILLITAIIQLYKTLMQTKKSKTGPSLVKV